MEAWIEERYADENSEVRQRDEAYLAGLRTTLAIDSGNWQEGIEWLNKAIELDEENKSRIPLTYIRLIRQGFYEEAIPLIQRDVQAPVRSDFWLGYVYHHLGNEGRAKREWTKATERDISKPENQHIMELILSRYYLGDPEGEGLSSVLQILSEKGSQYWAFFFLAGLGWAMRDNVTNAHSNFETAMLQRRSSGEGRRLPPEAWQYCRDLLDSAMQSYLVIYFEVDDEWQAAAEGGSESAMVEEEDSYSVLAADDE
jgi:tetratricopeptide (TPR) repeat protein